MSNSETPSKRKKYDVLEDTTSLSVRCVFLLDSLKRFYQNNSFEEIVLPILRDRKPICLRDLDWLVTNYSVSHPVIYPDPQGDNGQPFNVHDSYEMHLELWKKKLFDPFQRGQRIHFTVNGEKVVTTIAQLNFFRWAIKYGVIDWAIKNKQAINDHYDATTNKRKRMIAEQPGQKKKRMRLTTEPENNCLVYIAPMKISW